VVPENCVLSHIQYVQICAPRHFSLSLSLSPSACWECLVHAGNCMSEGVRVLCRVRYSQLSFCVSSMLIKVIIFVVVELSICFSYRNYPDFSGDGSPNGDAVPVTSARL
jgi:hypothetical protein